MPAHIKNSKLFWLMFTSLKSSFYDSLTEIENQMILLYFISFLSCISFSYGENTGPQLHHYIYSIQPCSPNTLWIDTFHLIPMRNLLKILAVLFRFRMYPTENGEYYAQLMWINFLSSYAIYFIYIVLLFPFILNHRYIYSSFWMCSMFT